MKPFVSQAKKRCEGTSRSTAAPAPAPSTELPTHQPPSLTDVLQPPHPSLKNDVPDAWSLESWSTAPIQSWVSTFDTEIQESAKEVTRILQTSKVTTEQLKEAATRYGLPLAKLQRTTIKSLQNLVSIGAALVG